MATKGNKKSVLGQQVKEIIRQDIGLALWESYSIYGTNVVMARAIADIFDGLKPVQKRILFTLYKQKYTREMVKSSAVCADTTKFFHPHGESIYLSLAKLAQDFHTRLSVIDTQGN
jgi:DNA gyrase subunit A